MHHRIKNSLHGVIGILRLYEARQIDPAALIDQCVVQLMAAAASFELASKPGKVGIPLPELVCDIAQSVEQVSRRHIGVHVSAAIRQQPITLTQEHSVNLSLAISELFFNAVKHGVDRHGQREVKVVVDRHDDVAILQVINVGGVLPAGFCFEAGTGLGTGLDLLKALIPAKGARLTISQQPEGVVAELRMQTPVVAVE
jgi:two-component sensor histidine kinase